MTASDTRLLLPNCTEVIIRRGGGGGYLGSNGYPLPNGRGVEAVTAKIKGRSTPFWAKGRRWSTSD